MPEQAPYPKSNWMEDMFSKGHPADAVPDFDYSEVETTRNSGSLPSYRLPRTHVDQTGRQVIEDEAQQDKTDKDFGRLYSQLAGLAKKYGLKDGDKVLLHDKAGHQFWYSKDSRHNDPGFRIWFPPREMM